MNRNVLKSRVSEYLALRNLTISDLAGKIGVSPATLYARFNSPERMTFEEFYLIRKTLGFSADAVTDVLGSVSCLPSNIKR